MWQAYEWEMVYSALDRLSQAYAALSKAYTTLRTPVYATALAAATPGHGAKRGDEDTDADAGADAGDDSTALLASLSSVTVEVLRQVDALPAWSQHAGEMTQDAVQVLTAMSADVLEDGGRAGHLQTVATVWAQAAGEARNVSIGLSARLLASRDVPDAHKELATTLEGAVHVFELMPTLALLVEGEEEEEEGVTQAGMMLTSCTDASQPRGYITDIAFQARQLEERVWAGEPSTWEELQSPPTPASEAEEVAEEVVGAGLGSHYGSMAACLPRVGHMLSASPAWAETEVSARGA
jgi:hypothetical protein